MRLFVVIFMVLTVLIITAGVKDGIEKWAIPADAIASRDTRVTPDSVCVHP